MLETAFSRGYIYEGLAGANMPLTRPFIWWALRPPEDLTPLIILQEAV